MSNAKRFSRGRTRSITSWPMVNSAHIRTHVCRFSHAVASGAAGACATVMSDGLMNPFDGISFIVCHDNADHN